MGLKMKKETGIRLGLVVAKVATLASGCATPQAPTPTLTPQLPEGTPIPLVELPPVVDPTPIDQPPVADPPPIEQPLECMPTPPDSIGKAAGCVVPNLWGGPNWNFSSPKCNAICVPERIDPESPGITLDTTFAYDILANRNPEKSGNIAVLCVGEGTEDLKVEDAYYSARDFVFGLAAEAGVENPGAFIGRLDDIPRQSIAVYSAYVPVDTPYVKLAIPADTRISAADVANALVYADPNYLIYYPARFLPEDLATTEIAYARVFADAETGQIRDSMIVVDLLLTRAFLDRICLHNAECTSDLSPQDELVYTLSNEIITLLLNDLYFDSLDNADLDKFMNYWLNEYGWYDESAGPSMDQRAREQVVNSLKASYTDSEVPETEIQFKLNGRRIEAVSTIVGIENLRRTAPQSGLLDRINGRLAALNREINRLQGRGGPGGNQMELVNLQQRQRRIAEFSGFLGGGVGASGQPGRPGPVGRRIFAGTMPI